METDGLGVTEADVETEGLVVALGLDAVHPASSPAPTPSTIHQRFIAREDSRPTRPVYRAHTGADRRTMRCRCGAEMHEDAEWCPVCLRKPVDENALVAELHDTFKKTTWAPPEELIAPSPPKRFSRWHPGPLSFGPRVKITLTVLISAYMLYTVVPLAPWGWFGHQEGYHPARAFGAFEIVLTLIVGALLLRAIWKRSRID